MSRIRPALLSLCLVLLAVITWGGMPGPEAAGGPGLHPHVPGEIIIRFEPAAGGLDRASALAELNATRVRTFRSGAEHWRLGPGHSVEQALERMQRNPQVRYVEPNYILTADVVPDDPRLGELYGMINTGQTGGTSDADIDADQAWGVTTGSSSVVVGVIDTGVDYNHPDLAANIWTNPGEIPGNMVDDDLNGYVDDVHGYDFYNNDGDPFDDNGHGTHVSGTIGAVGNNGIGVVGVNWNVKILGAKFLSSGGSGSLTGAIAAIEYTTLMGVDLTSNSWGGGGFSQALMDAIAAAGAQEIPFVAAAGNNGTNNDTSPHYPSNYNLPNVISVAASDHNDAPASFTNYGASTVDIAAPGVSILSTQPGNRYQLLSGTSMATPHVAGVVALLKSRLPAIPAAQARTALMLAADPVAAFGPGGTKPILSGGRLNAFFAIADPDQVPPGSIGDLATSDAGSNTMVLSWSATGDDGATGTATFYQVRYATSPIDESTFAAATRAGNEPNPLPAGSSQSMEVRGLDFDTTYYFAIKAFDEWGNPGAVSNLAIGTTLPAPTGAVSPAAISDALLTGQTADHIVTLRNDGVGTLDFAIPTPFIATPMTVDPGLDLDKEEPDPRPGVLGSGGPDASGYRWRDSDQPGGPGFAWFDISGIGTPVTDLDSDDENKGPIPIGFPFRFYGTTFTQVRVTTNGWLSFTSTSTDYTNDRLPSSGSPENLLAVFHDDLHFRSQLRARTYNDGSRFIVQWTHVDRFATATPSDLTFQAILYPSGRIVYQYLSMQSAELASATIGIQNATKSDGLTVVYNQPYVHDGLAIEFSQIPQWLTAAPASGRIHAGGSVPISVHLDASGLEGGTYPGQVNISSNDPVNPTLTVNVTLGVTGAPDAVVTPASLDYGDIFLSTPNVLTLSVLNDGTDVLHVSSVSASDPQLGVAPSAFDVANHAVTQVTVTLTPSSLGPFTGSITVNSDDAGQPAIVIPVTANAIPTPVVLIDPASISDTLFSGNVATHNLRVSNGGGSDLLLTAGADQGNGALGAPGVIYDDPAALGTGGPDGFGYRWRDSDDPGGPIFDFIDIRATGTPVTFSSQDSALSAIIPMGMDFPFYGGTFNQMKLSTNGWLTFNTAYTGSSLSTNGNLPSTTLPANSIAMFWDDLHIRNRGTVHTLYDGLRFIVQYTDFDRFSTTQQPSPAHLTFQVQLYPNGRIYLMYGTMTGFLTSATIGIQDGTRTIGLPVNFNTAYMHDNLAIQLHRTPEWLRVTPAAATVPPGGFQDFTVTLDSTDRPSGVLQGNVVLGTNIPGQETVQVPASLTVIGSPDVVTSPLSYAFGTVYIGYPQLTTFYVVNNGTADLNVSDITTTDPALVVEDQPGPTAGFILAPGAARVMTLRWSPTTVGPLNGAVRVHSDDPDSAVYQLTVTGQSLMPPIASHTPASFSESLLVGDVVDRTLHLENQGNSDLTFDAGIRLLSGATVTVHPEMELEEGDDETDPRPGILGLGGPDMYGYVWEDSDHPGGPAFDWVDISAVGTPVAGLDGDDENVGPIPIGFGFPFYGNVFDTVRVTSNGFLSFTSTLTDLSNDPLPSSGTTIPENLLAVFWENLHFRGMEKARYHNDGSRFIVQFTDVDRDVTSSTSHLTFQVILYPNGRIVYQYLTMNSTVLDSATIGIQNAAKNDGLTVVYNDPYVHDNLAVEFTPPFAFPSVTPADGVIPPGGSMDLNVRLDATGLVGGDYTASIDLATNDPARGLIAVPVSVHVTGIPEIDVQPASLVFPTTFVGFGSTLQAVLRNDGTDVLHVTGVSAAGDFATGLTVPVDVPVNGTVTFDVTFSPTLDGARAGTLTIASDDPDEGQFVVALSGNGLYPPEINVAPTSISTALPPGGSRTKTLTLSNTGASDLVWDSGTRSVSIAVPVTVYTELELGRDEIDPRAGILGTGGPDTFGYTWKDSDEPGGPVFEWVDISAIGTQISFDPDGYCVDCTSGPFPIGFAFPFYGNQFSQVRITTEGWISFTSTRTTFTNQPLPNSGTSVPENLIAAFWDDLVLRNGTGQEPIPSSAYYHNDGTRFIVQWKNFYRIADYDDDLNFQIILYPNGKIVYQYLLMSTQMLTSSTIGIQNATKDDGLTVVHNMPYMHDGLAIQIQSGPDWVTLDPPNGVIPAGGSQEIQVGLNAMGLDDGVHQAEIEFGSNDPYTPLLAVPVTLNVGLVEPTYLDFDPGVLNLSANGQCVKIVFELPAGLDPHAVNWSSLTLNDTLSYPSNPCAPPSFSDLDGDGVEEVAVKFDRSELEAVLAAGDEVPLTLQGEVTDVQWFRGTTMIRTIRPQVAAPNGGEYLLGGQPVSIAWAAASSAGAVTYAVHLSRDGGVTWEELATGLTGTSLDWVAAGDPTARARVRVVAMDSRGVMGYDVSDADFAIAGQMTPPNDVGDSLDVTLFGSDAVLSWRRPDADALHGPVEFYRILAAESPQGPFTQIATTTAEEFRLQAADGAVIVYYQVVAANSAGSSTN